MLVLLQHRGPDGPFYDRLLVGLLVLTDGGTALAKQPNGQKVHSDNVHVLSLQSVSGSF